MMCNRLFVFQALNKILIAGFSNTVPNASAHTSHAHWLAAVSSIMYSIILYYLMIFFGCKITANNNKQEDLPIDCFDNGYL